MALSLRERFKNSWNAFLSREPTTYRDNGIGYGSRPDRPKFTRSNNKSLVVSVYNQIAVDVAQIKINHCRVDSNGKYVETIDSGLNNALTIEANIDQTGRAFIQDVVMSMLDEGCIAIVPIDVNVDPRMTDAYDILTWRTGQIMEWFPEKVRVKLYNDRTGQYEELVLPKRNVAIVENPLYAVMNEPNSTLQRLIRKMNLLDKIDEQSTSGKLDLIIQLPYVIKSKARQEQAEERRKQIEDQLSNSRYGVAYTDGTERITQLNRSLDGKNLSDQIDALWTKLYNQLGLTAAIFDGTATESDYINYYNRTIEPIISAITDEMKRKFLSKTARTQKQSIMFFRDPFRLVTVETVANIADTFTRNEILSTNEVRGIIGYKPSDDPRADELRNKNLNENNTGEPPINLGQQSDETYEDYPEEYSEDPYGEAYYDNMGPYS